MDQAPKAKWLGWAFLRVPTLDGCKGTPQKETTHLYIRGGGSLILRQIGSSLAWAGMVSVSLR